MLTLSKDGAAQDFLNPELFRQPKWDTEQTGREQYAQGLKVATEWDEIYISNTGCWSASREGSKLTSYERIGYHTNTAELLRGFLAGTAKIVVGRGGRPNYTETTIKEGIAS